MRGYVNLKMRDYIVLNEDKLLVSIRFIRDSTKKIYIYIYSYDSEIIFSILL